MEVKVTMDTILIFTGYHHPYFTELTSGVYPLEWIFVKNFKFKSPVKSGCCKKRNRITSLCVLPSCYSISSRGRDKILIHLGFHQLHFFKRKFNFYYLIQLSKSPYHLKFQNQSHEHKFGQQIILYAPAVQRLFLWVRHWLKSPLWQKYDELRGN